MSFLFSKKYLSNLCIDIRGIIFNIIHNEYHYIHNKSLYNKGLYKIINVLSNTLKKIEDIYFIYFLKPNLQIVIT